MSPGISQENAREKKMSEIIEKKEQNRKKNLNLLRERICDRF